MMAETKPILRVVEKDGTLFVLGNQEGLKVLESLAGTANSYAEAIYNEAGTPRIACTILHEGAGIDQVDPAEMSEAKEALDHMFHYYAIEAPEEDPNLMIGLERNGLKI